MSITAEVNAALASPPSQTPTPTPAPSLARADRLTWVSNFNSGMRKQNVVGYAEIVGDILTIHSERTSSLRFRASLANDALMDNLRQMEITTVSEGTVEIARLTGPTPSADGPSSFFRRPNAPHYLRHFAAVLFGIPACLLRIIEDVDIGWRNLQGK